MIYKHRDGTFFSIDDRSDRTRVWDERGAYLGCWEDGGFVYADLQEAGLKGMTCREMEAASDLCDAVA